MIKYTDWGRKIKVGSTNKPKSLTLRSQSGTQRYSVMVVKQLGMFNLILNYTLI